MGSQPSHRVRHSLTYGKRTPTTVAKFGWLLSQLPLCYEKYVFVDVGCGKGRSLLMASDFPFQAIVGIELSPSLHGAAEDNIARYRSRHQRCFDIHALLANATAFEFPDEPLVLYFFHPFSDVIMRQVLDNLTKSLQACPRDVVIIYFNPVHQNLIADSGIFARLEVKGWNEQAVYRADVGNEPGTTGHESPQTR